MGCVAVKDKQKLSNIGQKKQNSKNIATQNLVPLPQNNLWNQQIVQLGVITADELQNYVNERRRLTSSNQQSRHESPRHFHSMTKTPTKTYTPRPVKSLTNTSKN